MSDSSTDEESDLRLYHGKFEDSINDDLNIPEALALLWLVVESPKLNNGNKINLVKKFDGVLGLDLLKSVDKEEPLPEKVEQLLAERQAARDTKDFQKSDELRKQIEDLGYEVKDTISGQQTKKL
jgi:cysteinyl-tRNA synthetase